MNKKVWWQWRGVWITTPLIGFLIIALRYFGLLQVVEFNVYDQFVRWKPLQKQDSRVVIVGIDEGDVRKIGNPIFPDGIYAEVIEKLQKHQPRVIGLDIYRDQPVQPGHEELVKVFQKYDNIVGITKVVGDKDLETIPAPPALKSKNQISFNDVIVDEDNIVRRALLGIEAKKLFSFAGYLALLYLEKDNIVLETVEENQWWKLNGTVLTKFQSNDGSYVNADEGGYQIILNYRNPPGHFERVSLRNVLEDKLPDNWGKDKVILIGFVGESFQDMLLTPYTRQPSERMAGVEFHANVVSQLLSVALDDNDDNSIMIKTWSDTKENLWIIAWAAIGATITWGMRHSKKKSQKFSPRLMVLPVAIIGLSWVSYVAFLNYWWIPVAPAILALLGSSSAITASLARSAGQIKNTFGRYLSDEIVDVLLESPEGVKLGGERKKITILTSDLRGFTATSESITPEEVVKILNFYLGYMTNIITKYGGIIDEFMGDGILVLFGAPISKEDDAERAVACALAMQLEMEAINKQLEAWGYSSLKMGIGINTGEVVVGNIGSEQRTKYGVVGSEVNLTYRIESYTIGGQILISEKTLKDIKPKLKINEQKQVSPKGVKEPLTIYSLVGIEDKYNLILPEVVEKYIELPEKINLEYSLLTDKDIDQKIFMGKIIELSSQGAKVMINPDTCVCPDSLKNLKIILCDLDRNQDLYAKVLKSFPDENYFQITFTHLPPDIAKKFNSLIAISN